MTEPDRAEEARPSRRAGERLRGAREAAGLTLEEVARRTRVPLRHLEAMEVGRYEGLPSPTYATGFAKAYARAIGLDEVEVARDVRAEASAQVADRAPQYEPFITADPKRLPSRGLAIAAAGAALAVVILAALWFGTHWMHSGEGEGGSPPAAGPVVATAPVRPAPAPVATGGQVVLAALGDVWLRVYDAQNKTLYLGVMKAGDSFPVPRDADHPQINVGRPDKLRVSVDGQAVPPLGDGSRAIKDVGVDAAAVRARLSGAPLVAPTPSPAPSATHHATPRPRHAAARRTEGDRTPAETPAPAPAPSPAVTTNP